MHPAIFYPLCCAVHMLYFSTKVVYIDERKVTKMDDEMIVQLYLERNEQAIPETETKYGNYCTSIANNILGNKEDAEECVNDTYFNTWNAIPPHRPKVLSTFLGKIVRNLAFNKYKYYTAEKRGGSEIDIVLEELADCISSKDDVEQAYEYSELVSDINTFLGELSEEKRNIFVCRYWYADSISDIAERYKMSKGAVSMVLNRIRNRLHDYLEKRGYEL